VVTPLRFVGFVAFDFCVAKVIRFSNPVPILSECDQSKQELKSINGRRFLT